jgi:outer membrane protein assembly factor BamA
VLAESPSLVLSSVRVSSDSPGLDHMLATQLQTAPGQKLVDAPINDDLRRLWKLDVLDDIQVEIDGSALAFIVTPHARVGRVVGAKGDELRRLALTVGAPFEPARISRMADAARMVYVKDGHLDAAVDVYQHPAANGAVDLCVAAAPGPRFTVGATTITGAKHLPEPALRKELCEGNAKGDMLDQDILECDKLHLEAAYWDRGYVDVEVGDAIITRHDGKLDIEIPVTREGGQYHLGTLAFANGPARPLGLRPGAVFSRTEMSDAINRVTDATGAANLVPITHVDKAAMRIDVTFEYSWHTPLQLVLQYLRGVK